MIFWLLQMNLLSH